MVLGRDWSSRNSNERRQEPQRHKQMLLHNNAIEDRGSMRSVIQSVTLSAGCLKHYLRSYIGYHAPYLRATIHDSLRLAIRYSE